MPKWQVAVCATDTVWGIVAKLSPENYSRIYEMKGRDETKPLIIFAKSIEALKVISQGWDSVIEDLAKQYFPGALTIIMPRSNALPDWVNPGVETIGMRVPASTSVMKLLDATEDGLLLSTSANLSGLDPVSDYQEALELFSDKVDLILKPEENESSSGEASTIISYIDGELRVLREGAICLIAS
jgi:L-threonylcarbamoyladenylate synthase